MHNSGICHCAYEKLFFSKYSNKCGQYKNLKKFLEISVLQASYVQIVSNSFR